MNTDEHRSKGRINHGTHGIHGKRGEVIQKIDLDFKDNCGGSDRNLW